MNKINLTYDAYSFKKADVSIFFISKKELNKAFAETYHDKKQSFGDNDVYIVDYFNTSGMTIVMEELTPYSFSFLLPEIMNIFVDKKWKKLVLLDNLIDFDFLSHFIFMFENSVDINCEMLIVLNEDIRLMIELEYFIIN